MEDIHENSCLDVIFVLLIQSIYKSKNETTVKIKHTQYLKNYDL